MSREEANRKEELFAKASAALEDLTRPPDRLTARPPTAWFVPGRVELLGKHTDYAGGRSLLCAVERGFCLIAREIDEAELRIMDARDGANAVCALRADAPEAGDWTIYPRTIARRLARDFGITRGAALAFASDLPPASGLSSSSALCIGVFLALSHVNRLELSPAFRAAVPDRFQLAGYLGAAENGKPFGPFAGEVGVGTLGGSEDHTAILCCEAGELLQCSFDPVRLERRLEGPAGHRLVIASSGVVAEKTGAARKAYNAAAGAVLEIQHRWRQLTGRHDATLARAAASSTDAPDRLRGLVATEPRLLARLEQFLTESEALVPGAGDALARGDLGEFGALVDRSQAGAEQGLHNQIAETIHLQRAARRLGAVAASAFGAGFGGSVWAMVATEGAEGFQQQWQVDYLRAFPQHGGKAHFFATASGPSALEL